MKNWKTNSALSMKGLTRRLCSMARGEATDQSDIDLLVRFSKRKSLLEMVKLEREVSHALGRKVDLLTEGAISPYLRDRVKRELRVIYGA
ncbi:MAG: nucleotidyltransferase family protein [Anaerolineae bacterium]|nr:nucleotidyltransferase family protein [Anaerolineae bacterium]